MSNSVVPAAAVAHAKQLVRNKNLTKQTGNQQHAPDEQNAADHSAANHHQFDAANVVQIDQPDNVDAAHLSLAMPLGDVSMGDSVFVDALAGAAVSEAALTTSYAAGSAQDDGGSASDDGAGGPGGTVLLVGAVGLAGLGVAVAASGGGNNDNNNGGDENRAPVITSGGGGDAAAVSALADAGVFYDADATDADGDTVTWALSGTNADLFTIAADGKISLAEGKAVEAGTDYTFTVTATDPDGATDTQTVTLSIEAPDVDVNEISLDVEGDTPDAPAQIAGTDGPDVFNDDAAVATDVIISGFGADDQILITGAAADDYTFTTGEDPNDLVINFNGPDANNIIVLDDVLTGFDGLIVDEASAESALAGLFDVQDSNFFNFA